MIKSYKHLYNLNKLLDNYTFVSASYETDILSIPVSKLKAFKGTEIIKEKEVDTNAYTTLTGQVTNFNTLLHGGTFDDPNRDIDVEEFIYHMGQLVDQDSGSIEKVSVPIAKEQAIPLTVSSKLPTEADWNIREGFLFNVTVTKEMVAETFKLGDTEYLRVQYEDELGGHLHALYIKGANKVNRDVLNQLSQVDSKLKTSTVRSLFKLMNLRLIPSPQMVDVVTKGIVTRNRAKFVASFSDDNTVTIALTDTVISLFLRDIKHVTVGYLGDDMVLQLALAGGTEVNSMF